MSGQHARSLIGRASSSDVMNLASESAGSPMQVGAILVLHPRFGMDLAAVRDAIGERVRAVPRLRQRLVRPPFGGGRPVWVDDFGFAIHRHVRSVPCAAPGNESSLLAVAADLVTDRLPMDRPLWSATLVTGLAGGDTALIIVFHHVLADGVGGLAAFASLVDGTPTPPPTQFPKASPTHGQLFADAFRTRVRAVGKLATAVRQLPAASAELLPRGSPRAPRCSLNLPTGPRRALAVARADLAAVRAVGHAHEATVNDVVLTAVAGALHSVLRDRGEVIDTVVVSVPVSARREASAVQLGNQDGAMLVALTATGDPVHRLSALALITRSRRTTTPGASAALIGPAFRILAKVGALRWLVNRQRLVNTFVTNLRGPDRRLSFLGAPITAIIPVTLTTGNVTVAFAVLSYAGDLVVTIVADPGRCPDLPALAVALQNELDVLTGQASKPMT
jgi:diacylglycerol O-acyltransferase